MKKITLLLFFAFSFFWGKSQVLNQPANWPNDNWTLTGTYDISFLYSDPTNLSNTAGTFSFDDDDAGNNSDNDIAAESPIIDLTAAYNAGEFSIFLNTSYVFRIYQTETIDIEYWDADTSQWLSWGNTYDNSTPSSPTSNYCNGPYETLDIADLNITSFTPNQLSNFKYRIYYKDNGSFGYGFCFTSPVLFSGIPPACPNISDLSVSNISFDSAYIYWTPGSNETSWEVVVQDQGSGIPTSNGENTSDNDPYIISGLNSSTDYEIYVRANCNGGDHSNWIGPINFSTPHVPRINFIQQPISVSGTYDLTVVDMDGDFLDDIVGVSSTNINIRKQNPDGSFANINITTPYADYLPGWSMAAADFDANGKTDLLYGAGSGVTFMKASDDGNSFTKQSTTSYVFSQRSNFVDINNDGNLDAFVCHDVEPNVYFINDGTGNFNFYQSDDAGAPYSLGNYPSGGDYGSIWIDYNNDRNIDLFIAKCGGEPARRTNMMLTNNGDYTYTENATALGLNDPMQTWSSAWGDFDNDGDMDVFVGASSGSHKLMENNGLGGSYTFTDVTSGAGISAPTGWESSTYDIDNDGYLDIISNGSIMYGNGDMTFEDADNSQINYKNGSFGDLNNDGFIDLYYNGTIYYNQGNSNNWVKINTIGMAHQTANYSNRNGIGARVEITTNAGTQIRDVRSGEGFEFMSSLTTHFGLGTETTINEIKIYWPSGIIDVIANPSINTTHNIQEGETLSIEDEELVDMSIYPNPVEDELQIQTSGNVINKIATIFDISGKRVLNLKLDSTSIDVSSLTSGVYFLRLESDGKIAKRKFIKK